MKKAGIAIIVFAVMAGVVLYARAKPDQPSISSNNNTATSKSDAQSKPAPKSAGKTLNYAKQELSELPKDKLNDSSVTVLDVSGNAITGALPAEIRHLSNLEELNASHNKMTGVPAEIGQLTKLKTINLSYNNLTGLPLEISNLQNLVTLDLRGNPDISQNDVDLIKPRLPNARILTDQK